MKTVSRGCGKKRVAGGTYIEVELSDQGLPIECFLVDEPLPLWAIESGGVTKYFVNSDNGPVEIKARGVNLVQIKGVTHVFDWVGKQFYPYVWDFIEEARRYGVSRRCEMPDYSMITGDSRLILVHPGAWIENAETYRSAILSEDRTWFCPKMAIPPKSLTGSVHEIEDSSHHCLGYGYHDFEELDVEMSAGGVLTRTLASGSRYLVERRPDCVRPHYKPAIFARFHIPKIVVVADAKDQSHNQKLDRLAGAGVPVELTEE